MKYKVLTLTQPYATLIALGMKKIETRSWSTSYRGPLAIHAAQGLGPVGSMRGLVDLMRRDVFWDALIPLRPSVFNAEGLAKLTLPRGAIVAVCELAAIRPVEQVRIGKTVRLMKMGGSGDVEEWHWTESEQAFGDYSAGRYAWLLSNVRALPKPIPAKGKLGLWEYDGAIDL